MPLTDIALCSRALIRLGVAPISSFADGTAEAEICGALYGTVRDALLSAYGWKFATGQALLTQLADAPVADYQFAYALPSDFLRALSAGYDGRGRGLEYRISGNALHSNGENVLLTYIYRPDESGFPPYFESVLIARLSAELCIPLTESTARADFMYQLASSEFARARQIDSQQDTPERLERFSLIDARN